MKKKTLKNILFAFALVFSFVLMWNTGVSAEEADEGLSEDIVTSPGLVYGGFHSYDEPGVEHIGDFWYLNGTKITDNFFFDGYFTYFLQADGTPMKDRLTYHPDGVHIIYFDENGHEVFCEFQYCESVGYTCYFDSQGYMYKDVITYNEDGKPVYLNANGKLEDSGWFRFANGLDYGFAYENGILKHEGFDYDPWGRVVYYHWNGMVARGLIQDYNNYYSMDETDGHFLGKFSTGAVPVYGAGKYIVGVNIPEGEVIVTPTTDGVDEFGDSLYWCYYAFPEFLDNEDGTVACFETEYDYAEYGSKIFTLESGNILYIEEGTVSFDVNNTPITMGREYISASKKGYVYDAKIGVHLPAGTYRIKMPTYEENDGYIGRIPGGPRVEVLTSSKYSFNFDAFKNVNFDDMSYYNTDAFRVTWFHNRRFYHECYPDNRECGGGEYVYVTVYDGEILNVEGVESVEYLGQ